MKRRVRAFIFFVLMLCSCSGSLIVNACEVSKSNMPFGNLCSVLLEGGLSADSESGIINAESDGVYCSGSQYETPVRISNDSASYINTIGETVYYISGEHEIVRLRDGNRTVIYSSQGERLGYLFVSTSKIYFLQGDTVYKMSLLSGNVRKIFTDSEISAFVPADNGFYWFKGEERLPQKPQNGEPEGTDECASNRACFLYSPLKKRSSPANANDAFRSDVQALKYSDAKSSDSLTDLALTATVGGKTIPTAEYPYGSYFTDNGKPCTNHRTGSCGYEEEEICNCKAYYGDVSLQAVQCYGYARYLYYYLFGSLGFQFDSDTHVNVGRISKGRVTVEAFKDLIAKARPGAHIRVTYLKPDGETISNHSLIIMDHNDVGFSACEGNLDAGCGTFIRTRAYSDYVPCLISVDFMSMPIDYDSFVNSEEMEKTTTLSSDSVERGTKPDQSTVWFDELIIYIKKLLNYIFI